MRSRRDRVTRAGGAEKPRRPGAPKPSVGPHEPPPASPAPPAPPGRAGNLMTIAAGAAPMLLILIGLWLNTSADFAQWDNLEIFLPSILFAHRRIPHDLRRT